MALTKCRECGNQISDQAVACPHCGAKPPKRTSTSTWVIGAVLGIPFIYAMTTRVDLHNEPPPKPKPVIDHAASRAATHAVRLRKSMRNPDSFKLEAATILDDAKTVCYEYRATNGFGAVDVGRAVLDPTGALLTTDSAWDRSCGGKSGRDVANAIRMFIL